jgi:hypothetical protein
MTMANAQPQPQPQPRPRKARGTVLPLSDADIARLATITAQDIADAQAELVPELREFLLAVDIEMQKKKVSGNG